MTNVNSATNMPPVVSSADDFGVRSVNNKTKAASDVQTAWEEDAAVNVTISDQSRELSKAAGQHQTPTAQAAQAAQTAQAAQGAGNNGAISEMARINREAMMSGNQLVTLDWNLGAPQPMPGIAQSTLRVWDLTKQLTVTMRGQHSNDLESTLRGLVDAYETVRDNLTSGSQGNAQNHVNFLDTAFRNMTLSVFEKNAGVQNRRQYGPKLNLDQNGDAYKVYRDGGPQALEQALQQARAHANSFAEAFLRNFSEHGAGGAFDFAWAAVSGQG